MMQSMQWCQLFRSNSPLRDTCTGSTSYQPWPLSEDFLKTYQLCKKKAKMILPQTPFTLVKIFGHYHIKLP